MTAALTVGGPIGVAGPLVAGLVAAGPVVAGLLAAGLLAAGLTGCSAFGRGGDRSGVSSECRDSRDGGQCALSLSLADATAYDYAVGRGSLPVLAGGVQVSAFVQTDRTAVRVWWRDVTGKDVETVVQPGKPQTVHGKAVVRDEGGSQRFLIHFQLSGSSDSRVDATITYG
jgi:hypothetical protein